MGGVNAISTGTDFAAHIAAMESRLLSRIASIQGNQPQPGQRNGGRGGSTGDPRPYPPAVSVDVRQQRLATGRELCSLPDEQSQERDRKIAQIVRFGELYLSRFARSPLQALGYVDAQTRLYDELYQEDCGHPYSYQYAVMITMSNGNLARVRVFAQRAVRSFVTTLGSDNSQTAEYADLVTESSSLTLFGMSMKWKTSVDQIPQGLGPEEFENWLWKREPPVTPAQPMSPPSQSLFSGFFDLAYKNCVDAAGCFQLRHSCFLGEIVETLVPHPLDLKIRDIHGKIVELHFYTKWEGIELESSQYQRGHTVAILNASQYVFKFGPRGIRQTDLEMIKVNTIAAHGLFCINLLWHLFGNFVSALAN
ncbi:uncharacterized protein CPUR_02972 [Claviceps purpurea 20.1]|uniref:Uncharacterized protein n=1 Tax=Claviceps purpurea (strain 20.1) TaxID=1111077 RepID=M1WD48_CLAP2|nr:uncharacterized protein CPUR_02972 [Claviceps purpurea 20.1]